MISQTELELKTERRGVLGGSDIGALWNLDYGCRRKLGYEKSGVKPDFAEVERPEFERGHYLEAVVARMYADKTMRRVKLAPVHVHPTKPYMVVHMDRIITAPEKEGEGYLEIKVVNRRTFAKFLKEGLHESYILQLQHGLAVTGYTWGSFAVLCLDPWQFKWFDVERDQQIIDRLEAEEELFMSDVAEGLVSQYEKLPIKDRRCQTCCYRHSCQGIAIDSLIPLEERDLELIDLPSLLPLAAEINELKTIRDDTEAMIADNNALMMEAIGSAAGAKYPGGRTIKIQRKGSRKWDSPALWALWDKATPRLKEMLKPYCNNGKEGKAPEPFLKHYWTGE